MSLKIYRDGNKVVFNYGSGMKCILQRVYKNNYGNAYAVFEPGRNQVILSNSQIATL